jgi:NOL1/NOP2/sun family putative RNA methylase
MISILGEEEFLLLQNAIEQERITSIRTNPFKIGEGKLSSTASRVPWSTNGFYLDERPLFTMDPLFHAGAYYAQEASSMFLEQILLQHRDKIGTDEPLVLDLCASPGGKSTLLASFLKGGGWLVANEVMKSRVGILNENLSKWGIPNVTVTQNDPKDFGRLTGLFDIIVIDAPCSGEGMFRKDDKAIEDWSLNNVQLCCERQKRIVSDVYPALKEGGLLIYSTCTYNEEEDEKNVKWISEELGADILSVQTEANWSITETPFGYHFYPHKTKGEGFFIAVLQKNQETSSAKNRLNKNGHKGKKEIIPQETKKQLKGWLLDEEEYDFNQENGLVSAIKKTWKQEADIFNATLHTIRNGVPVGFVKGKDLIPHETLALSTILNQEAFPNVECSWEMAIQFLKKENIILENQQKGFVLFCYQNIPLGFGKNLGNRCNNLFPSEWRIRMEMDKSRYSDIL